MARRVLEVRHLRKVFAPPGRGTVAAIADVSFALEEGEMVVLIGPSGCGKSTTLNIIAGLIAATDGQVSFGAVPSDEVRVAYIFQEPRLLAWRTVRRNIAFGLEGDLRHASPGGAMPALDDLVDLVGLRGFADKYPHELSGGMQQRVSLARALAVQPTLLLMDEPFGSLDALTRGYLQEELLGIVQGTHKSVVLITHDIDEALLLGDRILIMSARPGKIKEVVPVPFGRPRTGQTMMADPRYSPTRLHLLEVLRPEVAQVVAGRGSA